MRVAILTVSDRASSGVYEDETGPRIAAYLKRELHADVVCMEVLADERKLISDCLFDWSDNDMADVIVTNGGTGLAVRDVTPEATRDVLDREIPGLAEAMRAAGRAITPLADLSRQVVGQRAKTLIINLPGSPKGAVESLQAVSGTLSHAVELIRAER